MIITMILLVVVTVLFLLKKVSSCCSIKSVQVHFDKVLQLEKKFILSSSSTSSSFLTKIPQPLLSTSSLSRSSSPSSLSSSSSSPSLTSTNNRQTKLQKLPAGPFVWPIIGNLNVFGRYANPFEAFSALAERYGTIYSLRLGSVPCVVLNSYDLIKEVLIAKGTDFGGRPDFLRYHKLFGGDRNNSLALCDWSQLQKTRRSTARMFCSPKLNSAHYDNLNRIGCAETNRMLNEISKRFVDNDVNNNNNNGSEQIKPVILQACANMFIEYMCGEKYDYGSRRFQLIVRRFDEIFWEINQGYALDFLPWLQPFYTKHLNRVRKMAADIRNFISYRIIENRIEVIDENSPPNDFTDALLLLLKQDESVNLQHILFELEDFIGGHSAVGNLVMIMIAEIVKRPEVAQKMQEEIDRVTGRSRRVNLFDKSQMPYTESIIFETLRITSSPIVPHVATVDTHIRQWSVPKGTIIFLNNYDLNTSDRYWQTPERFDPERFIAPETRTVTKPAHFIPFSTGKRTCIGQKLVQGFAFLILASIFQHFDVSLPPNETADATRCCLALPPDTFSFRFTKRAGVENNDLLFPSPLP